MYLFLFLSLSLSLSVVEQIIHILRKQSHRDRELQREIEIVTENPSTLQDQENADTETHHFRALR